MIQSVALTIVIVFGLAITATSLYGLIQPEKLIGSVLRVWRQPGGMLTAVLVRVLLGLNLIAAAEWSRWPAAFTVLGCIALLAAIGILLAGRGRVDRIIDWAQQKPLAVLRAWLVFGLLFGAFLIWGAL